jgi:hypothetical protein
MFLRGLCNAICNFKATATLPASAVGTSRLLQAKRLVLLLVENVHESHDAAAAMS